MIRASARRKMDVNMQRYCHLGLGQDVKGGRQGGRDGGKEGGRVGTCTSTSDIRTRVINHYKP